MGNLGQDMRYALRQLNRSRSFAAVAILTLALGIGANTAIFSVIDSILLEPLPFPHQDRLVQLKAGTDYYNYPKGWIREYQRRAQSFSSVSGYSLNAEYNVTAAGSSSRAFGSTVSTNLFLTLGLRPALGRFFSAQEQDAGRERVVVLSDGFWRQQFAADPNVIGRNLLLDGVNRTIIGVAPPETHFPDFETQFWIPIAFKAGDAFDPWAVFGYQAIGRLRDGVAPPRAQAELESMHRAMLTLFPWKMPDRWAADVEVDPLLNSMVGDVRPRLLLLSGAVGLVLLIACANVANLMLARAAGRQREISLRSALGARTGRLIGQMLTESAVLAAISGLVGVLLAAASLNALKLVLPPDTPRLANLALHGDVFLFAAAISLLTGVLAGLVPALQAGNQDLQGSLRSNASNVFGSRHRFRVSRLLVVGQIALAVVVITAAGVMLRSLHKLSTTDPGFRARQTLTAQVSLDRDACTQKGACTEFFSNLLNRVEGMPGVDQAALVDALPMTGYDTWFVFDAESHPRTPRQLALEASSRTVSPSYFGLMGIRLLRGRLLTADDRSGLSRAALVNEAEANALWPNQDPIGKHLISVDDEPSPAVMDLKNSLTVVGVVSDTRHQSLDKASGWETYLPMTTASTAATKEKPVMSLLLRSPLSSAELAASLRALVEQLNPSAPVTKVRTLESVVSSSAAAPRSLTMLLTAFGALAILVGAIGVYSLISYTVSWRTREIGLRLALGANRNQIAKFVLGQSLALAVTGSALGMAGAMATTRLMRRFLFETSAVDPLTYSLVPVLFCVLALLAAWAPARRAAAVDPMIALRNE